MIYNEYGSTGAKVSVVGFGGMRFDVSRSNEENAELLLYAKDKGINYFDTAPRYCQDKSEDIFGLAFEQMADARDEFYVSTKGMPTESDTADKAIAAVEKSLKRLKVERIDFYHVWCIRDLDHYKLAMKNRGQYEGLLKCKEQGLIRNISVSTHLPGDEVRKLIEDKKFEGVTLGVNILNFMYRWEGVQAACEAGMAVVAMNPLSGGVIPKHEDKFGFLAGPGESPTEAALRFCINCPQITIGLNGFTTKEHIDMACKVADDRKPFTQADIERVKANISENMNALCTGCGYCMAKLCSENIPIAGYMQVYNEKLMEDKDDKQMVEAMNHHHIWGFLVGRSAGAINCIECGECEQACTQHLDIVKRLGELAGWEKQLAKSKKSS
jgi:hypothetical protein